MQLQGRRTAAALPPVCGRSASPGRRRCRGLEGKGFSIERDSDSPIEVHAVIWALLVSLPGCRGSAVTAAGPTSFEPELRVFPWSRVTDPFHSTDRRRSFQAKHCVISFSLDVSHFDRETLARFDEIQPFRLITIDILNFDDVVSVEWRVGKSEL